MKIFISFIMLMTSIFVNAQAATTLIGDRSCSEWMESKLTKKSPNFTKISNETWLLGYLSGLSSGSGKDALTNTRNSFIFTWIDNYCTKNPMKNISEGGVYLFLELSKR